MEKNFDIFFGFFYNYLNYCSALLFVGFFLVCVAVFSFLLKNNNLLIIFMAMEIILLGFSLQFIAISLFTQTFFGFLFALILLTMAAVEAALGLSVIVVYHRLNKTISLSSLNKIRG